MLSLCSRRGALKFPFSLEDSRCVVLGIPFEGRHWGNGSGARLTPKLLRKYFDHYYSYDLESGLDLYELPIFDAGDVKVTKSFEETKRRVIEVVKYLRSKNPSIRFCFIGGDHLVTPMLVEALGVRSLISLDAHLDLLSEDDARGYEHATAMRKVANKGVTLYVRGVRDVNSEELEYAKLKSIDWRGDLSDLPSRIDYLSIDLDVLDPIYVDTSAPVAMGIEFKQLLESLRRLEFDHADIVEWIPPRGFPYVARLFREILIKLASPKRLKH